VLPDAFHTPVATIGAELNARNPRLQGASPIEETTRSDENQYGLPDFRYPWVTFGLLAIVAVVLVAECMFAVTPPGPLLNQSVETLLTLGGLNSVVVLTSGEWYRLLTAPFLHANLLHLVFNGMALLVAGFALERLVGRAWFLALFIVGALGGSLLSFVVNPINRTSVGASGAIMALFAAMLILAFRLPAGPSRSRLQSRSINVLIPSLLPMMGSADSLQIDYAAHFGGAMGGAVVSLLLLRTWSDSRRLPRFPVLARGIVLIGVLSVAAASLAVASRYHAYQKMALLIPPNQLPKTEPDVASRGKDLAARYPRDPRAHMYAGVGYLNSHDYADAEREFRLALQGADEFRMLLGQQPANIARSLLALTLLGEGRNTEARQMALPACQAPPASQPPEALRKLLSGSRLCE
jgi:rhomboid protease GluP